MTRLYIIPEEMEVKILSALKRLTYRPELIKLVRVLGLRDLGRKLYYHWTRPRDGILRLECKGYRISFYVGSPEDLRAIEAVMLGEHHLLERLISILRPGDVVYDIGSNFGVYTILLAKAVGPNGVVIAFEPESQSYDHLQENLRLNALTNVRSFRLGLGDQSGEAKLFLGEVTGASSLGQSSETADSCQWVQVVEGDRLVEEKSLPVPRVVKIDVEGYEWAVIRGLHQTLARPDCELVCCEIHPQLLPANVQPQQVLDLLRSLGFSRIDVYPRGTTEYHVLARKEFVPAFSIPHGV